MASGQGCLIVVSGPGGVGKGTVVARLLERDPGCVVSRSWTTRTRRPGEGEDAYHFVTVEEFTKAIEDEAFLEWDYHFGNYYGSPLPTADDSRDLILEIDVNGAIQIQKNGHPALYVFIDTPSIEEQRERMIGRGDEIIKVDERLLGGERERELAQELPYRHVVNDDVDRCADEILSLIAAYRADADGVPPIAGTGADC